MNRVERNKIEEDLEEARQAIWDRHMRSKEDSEGKEDSEATASKVNDGLTATWYELPPGATELKHLIWYKNMNAQIGEIFRSCYRMNDCPHSDAIRNLNKIIAYAEQEKERIMMYEQG